MPDMPADSLDRLLAGELSRSEERRLAQAALDDPDLFDALTAAAVAKAGLTSADVASDSAEVPGALSDRRLTGRSAWMPAALVAGLAAAAALVLAVAFGLKGRAPAPSQPAASSHAIPAPALAAPILLSALVETAAATPSFRSGEAPSGRLPRQAGTILQVSDGIADIDLGSLDGLTEGMTIPIVRGARRLDRLTVTAVFRERARGRIEGHAVARTGDRVEIDRATHTQALLQQVAARRATGNLSAASRLASLAVSTANDDSVPADIRRRSLAELATLERQRGNLDDAKRLLQEAVHSFDSTPAATSAARADVLNELGVIQIEQRDFAAAERTLQSAQKLAAGPAAMRVTNNLGAIAALRGDRATADRLYRAAASLAAGAANPDSVRQAIAGNLAALQHAH
jgi:Flp pilus assembly protein TadD